VGLPSHRNQRGCDLGSVAGVVDARVVPPVQREPQLAQHSRHSAAPLPCERPERPLDVDPAPGAWHPIHRLVGKTGLEIPVAAGDVRPPGMGIAVIWVEALFVQPFKVAWEHHFDWIPSINLCLGDARQVVAELREGLVRVDILVELGGADSLSRLGAHHNSREFDYLLG